MRGPAINPALRRLWRSDGGLQLGIDPRRAVVVEGLSATDESMLALLDGSHDAKTVSMMSGAPAERVEHVVDVLASAGVLSAADPAIGSVPQTLLPDALSLSLVNPRRSGAATLLHRSLRRIDVIGAGRTGASLASLLAAAAVGDVRCFDDGPPRDADLAPGGLRPTRSGSRGTAARQQISRIQSTLSWSGERPDSQPAPDLVILAPVESATPPERVAAVGRSPHFEVVIRETSALLGPLVIPGRSACRRCAELARTERDPHWPSIVAQLAGGQRRIEPCDIVLASMAAAVAAAHALQWLDDFSDTDACYDHPLVDSMIEISLPDPRIRRREVHAHPGCGCGAAQWTNGSPGMRCAAMNTMEP